MTEDTPFAAQQLTPLDPAQKSVIRLQMAILGLLLLLLAGIAEAVLFMTLNWSVGPIIGLAVFAYLYMVIFLPERRYRRWGYEMGADMLRIVSGWIIRKETIVPFARVQHIDVSRGPIQRSVGVATLTLHTAGSFNSVVHLPGLALDDANRMRDEIRAHIKQDLP